MADVGSIAVRLTAKTARFQRSMRAAVGVISRVGAVASAVAGGGIGVLTAQSFRLIDAQTKTAEKLGLTQRKMAGYNHAAGLAGIKSTNLDTAVQRMVRRLSEAAQGTGEARGALRELGIDAKAVGDKLPAEQFETVIGALRRVGRQTDRVRLAFKLFDTEGVDLVRLIGQDLGAAAAEADKFGLSVSRVDAAKIELANDAVFRAQQLMRGLTNTLAISLAPLVAFTADRFVDMGVQGKGAADKISGALEPILATIARTIDLLDFLKATFLSVTGVLKQLAVNNPLITAIDLIKGTDMRGALHASAVKDLGKAADLFEGIGTGRNLVNTGEFFRSVADDAQKAAEKIARRSGDLFGGAGIAGAAAAGPKLADFAEIERSRFAIGGIGSAGGEQRVKDPQLEQTNRLLGAIDAKLGSGVPAVAT